MTLKPYDLNGEHDQMVEMGVNSYSLLFLSEYHAQGGVLPPGIEKMLTEVAQRRERTGKPPSNSGE